MRPRRICFVTGTRAEFGLMRSTLDAIRSHPKLALQIVVTGMHLDPSRGRTADHIQALGFRPAQIIRWPTTSNPVENARQTGRAISGLADALANLKPEIVLIVGDRVEAFAAAAAAHIAGRVVAHVHGGDRALGQIDDSLRHAITKLTHIHFPATAESAARIARLGEDRWRIHRVGSPGLDDLHQAAPSPLPRHRFALLLLHPVDADVRSEFTRARIVLRAVKSVKFDRVVVIYPNTDPGAAGIVRCWRTHARGDRFLVFPDLPRRLFLGLLRDAAALVGNSSSGIIEAPSFGTPVLDIGPRQLGRQRSQNVTNVPYDEQAIRRALSRVWHNGRPRRFHGTNVYGSGSAARKIAHILATLTLDDRIRRKIIAY